MSVFYFLYNFYLKLLSTHEEFSKILSKINVGLHVKISSTCYFGLLLNMLVFSQKTVCVCVGPIQHEWSCSMYERWKTDRHDKANSYLYSFVLQS